MATGPTRGVPADNAGLYARGGEYAGQIARLVGSGMTDRLAFKTLARAEEVGVKEARLACDFHRHVEAVAAVVPAVRDLILSGTHPHLTPAVVQQMAKGTAVAIRTRCQQAAAGLHPFAPAPPANLSPAEAVWHYDLDRLRQARSLLEQTASRSARLAAADRADLAVHTLAVALAPAPVWGGDGR